MESRDSNRDGKRTGRQMFVLRYVNLMLRISPLSRRLGDWPQWRQYISSSLRICMSSIMRWGAGSST
jgi:hypothetical protein